MSEAKFARALSRKMKAGAQDHLVSSDPESCCPPKHKQPNSKFSRRLSGKKKRTLENKIRKQKKKKEREKEQARSKYQRSKEKEPGMGLPAMKQDEDDEEEESNPAGAAEKAAVNFFFNWFIEAQESKESGLSKWPILADFLDILLLSLPMQNVHRRMYSLLIARDRECLRHLVIDAETHFLSQFEDAMNYMNDIRSKMQMVMRDAATGIDPKEAYQDFIDMLVTFALCMMKMGLNRKDLDIIRDQLSRHQPAPRSKVLNVKQKEALRKFCSCAMTGLLMLSWPNIRRDLEDVKDDTVLTSIFTMSVTAKGWKDEERPTLISLIFKPRKQSTSGRRLKGSCAVTPTVAIQILNFFKERGVNLNRKLSDGTHVMDHVQLMASTNSAFKQVITWLKQNGVNQKHAVQESDDYEEGGMRRREASGTDDNDDDDYNDYSSHSSDSETPTEKLAPMIADFTASASASASTQPSDKDGNKSEDTDEDEYLKRYQQQAQRILQEETKWMEEKEKEHHQSQCSCEHNHHHSHKNY